MSNLSSALLRGLGNFLQDHQVSFVNGLLIAITLGGEQVFRLAAFNCPCSHPAAFVYGISFLCAPAFILMVIGILVNNLTWRLFQGCAHRSQAASHGFSKSCGHSLNIVGRASVAPAAWIFVALLDGNYYVCLMSSAPCEAESENNKVLLATSQIISWIFLASIVALVSSVVLFVRCTQKLTFVHARFMSIYRDAERTRLEEIMKEKATELADSNIRAFFKQIERRKEDWDLISMAPLQQVECQKRSELYYTPLHRWADEQGAT